MEYLPVYGFMLQSSQNSSKKALYGIGEMPFWKKKAIERRRERGHKYWRASIEEERPAIFTQEETDMQVQPYLLALCTYRAVVNIAITIECAEGIVISKDSSLLASDGGHITFTKSSNNTFLSRWALWKEGHQPRQRWILRMSSR